MEGCMTVYMIGYDKVGPNYDYAQLYAAIENLGSHLHILDSTWLIVSNKAATEIHTILVPHTHQHDKLIVTEVFGIVASGLKPEERAWLERHQNP